MLCFQQPYKLENSKKYINDSINIGHLEGDGKYTKLCELWINDKLNIKNTFMMNSCTSALECALQILELDSGDEVIVPSFTYPSTANAVILAGGKVVFGEIEPCSMTLDVAKLENLINEKTKAIIVVHYGGISCDMDVIIKIAKNNNLYIIEDAAQSFLSTYKGRYTGTIGDFGCFSFHGTKDFIAGEGGALIVNNEKFIEKVEIFRQKGTNKAAFLDGKSGYYEWVDKGSSQSPSELNMALLYGQLQLDSEIISHRKEIYKYYKKQIGKLIKELDVNDQVYCSNKSYDEVNGHLFFLVFSEVEHAVKFRKFLLESDVETRTHFIPLHESKMGKKFIKDSKNFKAEQNIGKRLIRLPIYPQLTINQLEKVVKLTKDYLVIMK